MSVSSLLQPHSVAPRDEARRSEAEVSMGSSIIENQVFCHAVEGARRNTAETTKWRESPEASSRYGKRNRYKRSFYVVSHGNTLHQVSEAELLSARNLIRPLWQFVGIRNLQDCMSDIVCMDRLSHPFPTRNERKKSCLS